jgi:hypothetical protein
MVTMPAASVVSRARARMTSHADAGSLRRVGELLTVPLSVFQFINRDTESHRQIHASGSHSDLVVNHVSRA